MSEQTKLIKELLDYVEEYEKEGKQGGIKAFSIFLRGKVMEPEAPREPEKTFDQQDFRNFKTYPEVEFSTLLTGLYRFAKHYLKKAFTQTAFKTIDEFGFLATLLRDHSLLKNELINEHLLEMSSGSEIIKRLVKNGLIYEYPDEHDRRAKRVSLTVKGQREVFMAFNDMHKVSEIIIGDLKKHELMEALAIFNKLTFFHQHIHQRDKHTDIETLHEKYVNHGA
ncbi:MAG: winged helix-turn-helix transcriptional regulator [Saprospiraceae bacterium]|nr:winged helix-turn-helix transcriptional regulator [Saprospiraceae bacterium]MCB9325823.1 winged helix-turn-helix transcriptional regulator [Lewinellaceae bacterium]